MTAQHIQSQYEEQGAIFLTDAGAIAGKLAHVDVFLFDWDGVFNNGMKYGDAGSPFSEGDSMGVNLLRLDFWLRQGRMPMTGIITGATNEAAAYFARREGLEFCIRGFTDKGAAWTRAKESLRIDGQRTAFVYDDVLDLPVAADVAVRCCVRRSGGLEFGNYVVQHDLGDFITTAVGGAGAVREICELWISLAGDYARTVETRMAYGAAYQEYLAIRKNTRTIEIIAG